jgi:hypothetical protein
MKTKISIEWDVTDVKSCRPQLSKKQCQEVLAVLENNHDAQAGINWEVVEECADDLFPMDDII